MGYSKQSAEIDKTQVVTPTIVQSPGSLERRLDSKTYDIQEFRQPVERDGSKDQLFNEISQSKHQLPAGDQASITICNSLKLLSFEGQ